MAKIIFILILLIAGLESCKQKTTVPEKKFERAKRGVIGLQFDFQPYLDKNKLAEVDAGDLFLSSGKIVAGDPFFIQDKSPFTITVTPGKYPLKILISKIEDGHYRVAFAKIVFQKAKPIKWVMALTSETTQKEIDSLEEGDFFGYGVDAGLGCFIDAETNIYFQQEMDKFYKEHLDGNYYTDVLASEFKKGSGGHRFSREDGDWCNHFPLRDKPNNIIIFSSGWGDGYYPTYWGYDDQGRIVELITDFLVVTGED